MPRENPNPQPSTCLICRKSLKIAGRKTAEPWPEEGTLYTVVIYTCSDLGCPGSNRLIEYWPELPD